MTDGQRNFIIVLLIVVAAIFVPQVAGGLAIISQLVNIAFIIVLGMMLLFMYQQRQDTIRRMDLAPKIALLGSGGMLFLITLTGMLVPGWASGGQNTVVFFGLSFACVFGMVWAWSQRTGW